MQLDTARNAADLLESRFRGRGLEAVAIVHLDSRRRVLAMTEYEGDEASAELPVRAILEEAFRLGSAALVVAHNHPAGDPDPSEEDLAATRRLVQVAEPLGIRLHDHLIFAGPVCRSLRGMGLL